MLNHITLAGRLVRNPELRRTQNGTAVASFTLACERDFKNESGDREVDFIDCVAWRKTAELVSGYFTKGRMAIVSGRMQIRGWTDKDGNRRKSAEILVDNIYFGDSKPQAEDAATEATGAEPLTYGTDKERYSEIAEDDDQLPF